MSSIDAQLAELRDRITRLEDRDAIWRLKARYLNAVDGQQPEIAASCFAEGEIVIDMGHVGRFRKREEFAELYRAAGCHPWVLDMHHGSNPEVEFIDSRRARAVWALDYRNINTRDKTVTFLSLQYHDEYTKIEGEWKITSCRTVYKTLLTCSYADGVLRSLAAGKSVTEAGA
jgi:hypothetical protein